MRQLLFLSAESQKSLRYLVQWILISIIAGATGTAILAGFMFLYSIIKDVISSLEIIAIPILAAFAGLLVGFVIYRIEPHASGEGVPSYLKSLRHHDGRLSFSESFYKFWAALFTLSFYGNGGFVGPLGRISAGVMSRLGKLFHKLGMNEYHIRTCTICGFASVTGALFYCPIGGGLFAVEIIQKANMRYRDLFPAILSSSMAVLTARTFSFGPIIQITAIETELNINLLWLFILIAVCTGIIGRLYIYLYARVAGIFKRAEMKSMGIKAAAGMLLATVPLIAINPNLLGVSIDIFNSLLSHSTIHLYGALPTWLPLAAVLVILLVLKAFASAVTTGSGLSAGITGPAILLGMLVGAFFAELFGIAPLSGDYFTLIAAGFAGMLSSIMNVPIAASVITIEIFGLWYGLPAGLASVISFQINRHNMIYDLALAEDNE